MAGAAHGHRRPEGDRSRAMTRRGAIATGFAAAVAGWSGVGGRRARADAPEALRLDRSALRPTFAEAFDRPPSLWDPRTRRGRWKTNFFYGDPFGPSGRVAGEAVAVDSACCGVDPFRWRPGRLEVELARTTARDPRLGGRTLTGGVLTTERSFAQTYGYFECRLASPDVPGLWPAFWLYSAPVRDLTDAQWDNGLGYGREWTGGLGNEIDVVEILTNATNETNHTASARHAWRGGVPGAGYDPAFTPAVAGTHVVPSAGATVARTYGALWTAERIVWYVDDVEVARDRNPGIHDPMYMIVGMGAGGWNGNALPRDFVRAAMTVDYVRAFAIA